MLPTAGVLDLHFQVAPGPVALDRTAKAVHTCFVGANVLVAALAPDTVDLGLEAGWSAWTYGQRSPRAVLAFRHAEAAPARFLTAVVPYASGSPPSVSLTSESGAPDATGGYWIEVEVGGRTHRLSVDFPAATIGCG